MRHEATVRILGTMRMTVGQWRKLRRWSDQSAMPQGIKDEIRTVTDYVDGADRLLNRTAEQVDMLDAEGREIDG